MRDIYIINPMAGKRDAALNFMDVPQLLNLCSRVWEPQLLNPGVGFPL